MRLRHLLVAIALLQLANPALYAQKPATGKVETSYDKIFAAAVADYNANRNLQATTKFQQVLKKYPQHVDSRRYLSLLRNRIRKDALVPVMKKKLATIMVEQIDFDEATLAEVMEYVIDEAKKRSGGKIAPGLVIHGGDAVRDRTLTFKTGKAPLSSIIDTAAKLTNTRVEYSDYALSFKSLPSAAERQAQAAKKLEAAEAKARAAAAAKAEADDPFLRKR